MFPRKCDTNYNRPLLLVGSELSPNFQFTPQQCFLWQVYQGVLASLIIVAADIILIVRGMYLTQCLSRCIDSVLF